MARKILSFATVTLLFFVWSVVALAQSGAAPSAAPPPHAHQEPCWRQAGIDRSIMEQRHAIEDDAHSQVQAVCESTSLTPQQKRKQVREIHEQAREKSDALITADQLRALHSCQQERHHPEEGHHGGGPCGNEAQTQPSAPTGKAGGSNPQAPENNSPPN